MKLTKHETISLSLSLSRLTRVSFPPPSRSFPLSRTHANNAKQATIRDIFTPVYIVILLVILKIVIGEESLPPVPKLPATTTSCAPSDPTVAMHAVCWHYPVRTPLEKVVGYVPRASPVVASLMDDVMRRVSVAVRGPGALTWGGGTVGVDGKKSASIHSQLNEMVRPDVFFSSFFLLLAIVS